MLVSLLGAGPGDPGLLTLAGKAALERCNVVIYDALANREFLKFAPHHAEKIYVGKVADKHALPQPEINALLASKAREQRGKRVVRLKGGDPFIFGRGGEEALFLKNEGIPFEIIPGISSAIAVPEYAGISLTHRNYASSLTILTGHENPEKEKSAINWEALAKSGSTLVFVMGMKNLAAIVNRLLSAGMSSQTPAAVIYRGTTPFQKAVFASLQQLPNTVEQAGIGHPAIIVIGEVVSLASELSWFKKKPLSGKTILVTRAREQASGIADSLTELGANVIQFPTIKIVPPKDSLALETAIKNLHEYDWLVFTSVNGVKYFWQYLLGAGKDARSLSHCKIACIGGATAKKLESCGIMPDVIPEKFVAESLVYALDNSGIRFEKCKFLLPRATNARSILVNELVSRGAIVDVAPAYETVPEESDREFVEDLIRNNEVNCVSFGSSSTVRNFLDLMPADLLMRHPEVKLAAIGPVTADTLEQYGLHAQIVPEQYDIPSLVQAIKGYFCNCE